MIEKVNKITLVILTQQRDETLERLKELELFHIKSLGHESHDYLDSLMAYESLQSAVHGLQSYKFSSTVSVKTFESNSPAQLAEAALSRLQSVEGDQEDLYQLEMEREKIAVWGHFSPEQVSELRGKGLGIELCVTSEEDYAPDQLPEGSFVQEIKREAGQVYFVILSTTAIDETIPKLPLPQRSLAECEEGIQDLKAKIQACQNELKQIAQLDYKLQEALVERGNACDHIMAGDSFSAHGPLEVLEGYVPAGRMEELKAEALKTGWALQS
ncbi:MAG: hypothetical protein HQL32_13000, partial [Planctomycetes bacterium]|nr:hypothetical protein [Planctomycetota bacterium]